MMTSPGRGGHPGGACAAGAWVRRWRRGQGSKQRRAPPGLHAGSIRCAGACKHTKLYRVRRAALPRQCQGRRQAGLHGRTLAQKRRRSLAQRAARSRCCSQGSAPAARPADDTCIAHAHQALPGRRGACLHTFGPLPGVSLHECRFEQLEHVSESFSSLSGGQAGSTSPPGCSSDRSSCSAARCDGVGRCSGAVIAIRARGTCIAAQAPRYAALAPVAFRGPPGPGYWWAPAAVRLRRGNALLQPQPLRSLYFDLPSPSRARPHTAVCQARAAVRIGTGEPRRADELRAACLGA